MTQTAPITEANPTVEEMEARVARFRHLQPTDDYVDSGMPGCERTTLRVLGHRPGAPLAAEGFHMSLVQCEPGKAAPLHNHLTQEVFVALTGRWEVFWGPLGQRQLTLEPWDTVSVPPGVSRGFRNVGSETAWLMGMASGHEPGTINWPEQVRAAAASVGITLPRPTNGDIDMSAEKRIQALGLQLPVASAPAGNYAAAVQSGDLLFLSGKAPLPVDGQLPKGRLGQEYSAEDGYRLARSACLDLLAVVRRELGSLDRVARIVELHGSLNSVPAFEDHARVLDGASDLLVEVFGPAGGVHARSVVGVASLRKGVPLTVKATIEVKRT